jgi:hypothetical protein
VTVDVSLTVEESAAVGRALRTYLSDLRAEIVDTDNPEFKRGLRAERDSLEAALSKLDQAPSVRNDDPSGNATVTIVELWWTAEA